MVECDSKPRFFTSTLAGILAQAALELPTSLLSFLRTGHQPYTLPSALLRLLTVITIFHPGSWEENRNHTKHLTRDLDTRN